DAVKGVVRHGLVVRFLHPGIKGLAKSLPFILDSEVDEGGGAPEGGGNRAGLEIVGAGGAAEGHVQVGVNVDAAGDHEKSCGVDDAASVFDGELGGQRGNLVAVDSNFRGERV